MTRKRLTIPLLALVATATLLLAGCNNLLAQISGGDDSDGDTSKAQNIFERLVRLDGTFEEEHKHLFNEFGIQLRKNSMIAQAIMYYERALEITQQDENLYMNMARAQLENENIPLCLDYLLEALKIDPTHAVSLKFLAWLKVKGFVPEQKRNEVDTALAVAHQIMQSQPASLSSILDPTSQE